MEVGRRGADGSPAGGAAFPGLRRAAYLWEGSRDAPNCDGVRGLSKAFEDMAKTQRVPVQEVFLHRRPHSSPTPSSSSTPPTPHTSQSHTHNSSSYAAADNPCSP